MSVVRVHIYDPVIGKMVKADGIPVRIGVIDDLFVATNKHMGAGVFLSGVWNITHIPSGAGAIVNASSPEEAVRLTEAKIRSIGKAGYQRLIRKAMRRTAASRKGI